MGFNMRKPFNGNQLLKVVDMWTESLESGGQLNVIYTDLEVIYTDLEKAFDKVPHKRLISKLYLYKINPGVIKWIISFLANRRQRVSINGFFSFWMEALSGIPQGSILGPFLFIIFINDLVDSCNNASELFLYTDYTKLFRHITCNSDVDLLQTDLLDIRLWMETWLLKLNIKNAKLFHMVIVLTLKTINTYSLWDQYQFLKSRKYKRFRCNL